MRILSKSGDEFLLLAHPSEQGVLGDYIMVQENMKSLLLQVYDQTYADTQGLMEDIVQEEIIKSSTDGIDFDPLNMNAISNILKDMRILKCKTRGYFGSGARGNTASSIPSRIASDVRRLTLAEVFDLVERKGSRRIRLGKSTDGEKLDIYAEGIDGSLNIITGKKGSGKSHLAKMIARGLANLGANVVVFDINNEYSGLSFTKDGGRSNLSERMTLLKPGEGLRFTLRYLGLSAVLGIFQNVLDIPAASLREFIRIWQMLEENGSLNMGSLSNAIKSWRCNEFVRDALISRLHSLNFSGLFTDNEERAVRVEDLVTRQGDGRIIVVSLGGVAPLVRRITVELMLGKLVSLLEGSLIPPIFLFAEEAHLYLRETYWDDLVTRMRHFGIFPTLITNQPDAIDDSIYRQADNIFLFNFTSDLDLEMISRASTADAASIKSVVRHLRKGTCLILGKVVEGMPAVVDVENLDVIPLGETKLFFTANRSPIIEKVGLQVDPLSNQSIQSSHT